MASETNGPPVDSSEDQTRSNEVMFTLAKEVFADELARWTRIEDKAGRFLTVIGLMVAILTWVGHLIRDIYPPEGWNEWALTVVMVLLFMALWGAGWFCFQALRFGKLAKVSIDKKVFSDQKLAATFEGYTNEMIRQQSENQTACDLKVRRLEHAYTCLSAAFFLALVDGALISIYLWQNPL